MVTTEERLVPLSQLIGVVEQTVGVRLHISTLHRWITRGVRGRKLSATRLGGRWLSSVSAVRQFCGESNSCANVLRQSSDDVKDRLAKEFGL